MGGFLRSSYVYEKEVRDQSGNLDSVETVENRATEPRQPDFSGGNFGESSVDPHRISRFTRRPKVRPKGGNTRAYRSHED